MNCVFVVPAGPDLPGRVRQRGVRGRALPGRARADWDAHRAVDDAARGLRRGFRGRVAARCSPGQRDRLAAQLPPGL